MAQQYDIGGVDIYIHKYLGPCDNDDTDPTSGVAKAKRDGKPINETTIQDLLFLENRDRKYDKNIYQMRGHYVVADNDFDLSQFGLMMSNDNIYITTHFNTMMTIIGRKLMSGDVIELPHMRDDALLDESGAINRFYVIDDADYAAEGYSQIWRRHLWRCNCRPLKDSPEFRSILGTGKKKDDLKNLISTYNKEISIASAIVESARENTPLRNFDTVHFYIVPGTDGIGGIGQPSIWTSDGEPPNGALPLGSGTSFPKDAKPGDYYLRVDYEPNVLFLKTTDSWESVEVDYRRQWSAAHRILQSFIGNDKEWTDMYGDTVKEKQDIKKTVKPRATKGK